MAVTKRIPGALVLLLGVGSAAVPPGLPAQSTSEDGRSDGGGIPSAATSYPVSRSPEVLRIDGRLDEAAWEEATPIPLPYEIAPGDHTPATVATECRVTFDDRHLYLGCVAHDPEPGTIRAFMTDRDRIFGNNDRISFLIDPFNDARRGWVFEVSPLGVQADLVFDERTDEFDESWDAIWTSAGRITESGYVIEAAIPFRSLRFPRTAGVQTWRFWINRMRPRDDAYRIMRTNTRIRGEACQLCQAPVLVGLGDMSPGTNLEVAPVLVASRTDTPAGATGELTAGPLDWEPGVDARWGITTDLALNVTLNPDFSQVEADVPQLDANNRFALFFPEKRPFFLEGADLFQTPLRPVFSRSVADPVGGVKLTGKLGRHGIGVLLTRDRRNNLILPGPRASSSASLAEDVSGAMARYRRDVGGRHSVGALYTGRIGEGRYRNHVAGLDGFFQPAATTTLNVQVLGSTTEYDPELAEELDQPAGSFSGIAFTTYATFNSRVWGVSGGYDLLSDGFRSDAGFTTQVDVRRPWVSGRRTFYGKAGDLFTRVDIDVGAISDRTMAGDLIQDQTWLNLYLEGPRQIEAWLNPGYRKTRFGDRDFELFHTFAGFTLRPHGSLRVGVSGNRGASIDVRNTRRADELRVSPSLDWQIGRNGEAGLSYHRQRLSLKGEEVFTAQVGQLRAVYNFDTRAYVRAIVQYRRTYRDPDTNPGLERSLDEALFTSLLFSYKINPLTVLFLGLTDDRAGLEDVGSSRVSLAPQGRTFFLKVGYAWRP